MIKRFLAALALTAAALVALAAYDARAQSPYIAPDGRAAALLIAAHVLPDPSVTPGVLNPAVTPATIKATVCVSGWTATVRPPTPYTNKLKVIDTPKGMKIVDGELDHLISIEDGGSPSSPQNLWYMAYADRYGARVKDVLETRVKHLLCAGKISLDDARAALSPNWLLGYVRYVGPLPK